MHSFYFSGEVCDGETVRVYAIYGVPKHCRKKLPALLHIHGGGQTAFVHWLNFWNERGYAALSFDWGGEWGEQRPYPAIWGERLKHCNNRHGSDKICAVHPSPRESSWYHWALVSRRALTVLERQKEVDPKRLGIFGISMGGTIVWNVAGMDRRVKAACAIYGVGWNSYPADKYENDPKATDPDSLTWRRTMAPESYASLVKCPTLFLNASNDQHGKMDRSFETLNAMRTPWRIGYTPRYRHHIAEAQGRLLPHWMDTCLRGGPELPQSPRGEMSLDPDGVPLLRVSPDAADEVSRVEVFYAIKNAYPLSRYWRDATVRKKKLHWLATLPVLNTKHRLFAFANVHYRAGFALTSNFEAVIPADLGRARATDKRDMTIADFKTGLDGFITHSTTPDPCVFLSGLVRAKGPGARHGIRQKHWCAIITHKIGDPRWQGPDGATLHIDVYSPQACVLEIVFHENEGTDNARRFKFPLSLRAGGAWRRIRISAGQLEEIDTEKPRNLKNWRKVNMLEFRMLDPPKKRPILTNIRWVLPKEKISP